MNKNVQRAISLCIIYHGQRMKYLMGPQGLEPSIMQSSSKVKTFILMLLKSWANAASIESVNQGNIYLIYFGLYSLVLVTIQGASRLNTKS